MGGGSVRHNSKDPLCECRKCRWPPRLDGAIARAVEELHILELFNTGETSRAMQVLLAHAASLSHKGGQGGSSRQLPNLTGDDFFRALDKHADARMVKGKHPRPCWQKGIRDILGIGDDRTLIRWMKSLGKTPQDAEDYLNEKSR
jgi:hypothetical protein